MSDPEKKIIIDEDWKTQVEREREELETKSEESSRDDTSNMGEIPPASISMLVTSIATQAMMALGQVPDPVTGQAMYHPELARLHIDTLVVLQEKTAGNLTPDETEMLESLLNQLRQLFLAAPASMEMPPSPTPPC